MKKRWNRLFILIIQAAFVFITTVSFSFAQSSLLSKEESLWLSSRNNTIIVFPEKNYPPFSYQTNAGIPQGLAVDYIELVAKKLGATVSYLPARSRTQIIEEAQTGKGDVIVSLSETPERSEQFLFTEEYISVPAVIVQRKDVTKRTNLTPSDFVGKKVAVASGYAVEAYLRENYPRVILETVSDNEIALQLLVLGDVDAAVMDVASLSYFLSRQTLTSVSIVGHTGFYYNLSFAVSKQKAILQSILEKGLFQISTAERTLLSEKWVGVVAPASKKTLFGALTNTPILAVLYGVLGLGFLLFFIIFFRHRRRFFSRTPRSSVDLLKGKMEELEDTSKILSEELEEVKEMEEEIAKKIHNLQR